MHAFACYDVNWESICDSKKSEWHRSLQLLLEYSKNDKTISERVLEH